MTETRTDRVGSEIAPARVVVLGGGFAGLEVAMELQRKLPAGRLDLTVVNRDNFCLFTPMLHEVAASDLDVTHIVNPIRKFLRHGALFVGEVERIDLKARRVQVSHADGGHRHVLEYDHLVIALGSVTNYYGIPGLQERAIPMKSLGDAIQLRNRLIQALEEADFECAAEQRKALLTFLVAGGGFAGVETSAGINDFVREAGRYYRHLAEGQIRIVLVHPGAVILPELDVKLGRFAQEALRRRGVEIRLETRVTAVTKEGVELSDGTVVSAKTIVWTAGTTPSPLLANLPCHRERGRVLANEFLEVPGWPGVWALGDCALVPDLKAGGYHPPTAQHAIRQGKVAAHNIAASILGDASRRKPFVFSTLGQLAAIGRRSGVANILGRNFSGFLAWWLWRTIYLFKLPTLDRKVRVMLDWTLDLVFSKDIVQFQTIRSHELSEADAADDPLIAMTAGPAEASGF